MKIISRNHLETKKDKEYEYYRYGWYGFKEGRFKLHNLCSNGEE